jgi:Divergent InlB B-repeat domain
MNAGFTYAHPVRLAQHAIRVVTVLAFAVVVALSTAGTADSRAPTLSSGVIISIKGWGNVALAKGFSDHRLFRCSQASCSGFGASARGGRVILTASPDPGWRFVHWRGVCTEQRPRCRIDLSRRPVNASASHTMRVEAVFIATERGLSRTNPIPIGNTAYIGAGFQLRINSFTPDVQLSPPAPGGGEFVTASVTATYVLGWWSDISLLPYYLDLIGSHNWVYSPGNCPNGGPPPTLDSATPSRLLYSGQSATGNVCWLIDVSDATTVELRIDPSFTYLGPAPWFALR